MKQCTLTLAIVLLYLPQLFSTAIAPENQAILHVDFEGCAAYLDGSHKDFSEFVPKDISPLGCSRFSLNFPAYLHQVNMPSNVHSCTEGIYPESLGMCISSSDNCEYTEFDNKALRFSVNLSPGKYGLGALDSLSFFQKAPEQYNNYSGLSGPNNYPLSYGLRILKDGVVVFRQVDLPTAREWEKTTVDLSVLASFKVTTTTTFQIEILPYCPVGNGYEKRIFDIDEFYLYAGCEPISAGRIYTNDETTICNNKPEESQLTFYFQGVYGTNSTWLITDINNRILGLSTSSEIDFRSLPGGNLFVYHMVYETGLIGLQLGNRLSDLVGCYDRSNAVGVINNDVQGGRLSDASGYIDGYLCPSNNLLELRLENEQGEQTIYVLTDASRRIVSMSFTPTVDLSAIVDFPSYVSAISYSGQLNVSIGQALSSLDGCFALSNEFRILGELNTGDPVITNGPFCLGDSQADILDIDSGDYVGRIRIYVVTDASHKILAYSNSHSINLGGLISNDCLLWQVVANNLNTLTVGENLDDLRGDCLSRSQPIAIPKVDIDLGPLTTLSGQTIDTVCISDVLLSEITFAVGPLQMGNQALIVTDATNDILDISLNNTLSFLGSNEGIVRVWQIAYPSGSSIMGYATLDELMNLGFCIDLSENFVTVVKVDGGKACNEEECTVSGGFIDLFGSSYCVGDGEPDLVLGEVQNAEGAFMQLIVTDMDSLIVSVPNGFGFNVDGAGPGSCIVWNIASDVDLNFSAGTHIGDITGDCFNISPGAVFNRIENLGGQVSLVGGADAVELCVLDTTQQLLSLATTGKGLQYQYIVTDNNNVILSLPVGNLIDFTNAAIGTCRIWGLAYNASYNQMPGEILDIMQHAGRCLSLSFNFVEVTRVDTGINCEATVCEVEAGFIDLFGNNYCVGDGEPDLVLGEVQNAIGPVMQLVVTDPDSVIISVPSNFGFDVDGAGPGRCIVWNIASEVVLNLSVGTHISDISGDCIDISSGATFNRIENFGGQVSLVGGQSAIELCVLDTTQQLLSLETTGKGMQYQYIVTDSNDVILSLPVGNLIDFTNAAIGTCRIWGLAFNSSYNQMPGEILNIIQPPGRCFNLSSNFVEVTKIDSGINCEEKTCEVEAGFIDLFGSDFCVGDGIPDLVNGEVIGASGQFQQLIISDATGMILSLPSGFMFDIDGAGIGTCFLYNLVSDESIDLELGAMLADISGTCIDLSEPAVFNRIFVSAGTTTLEGGGSSLSICAGDGEADTLTFSTIDTIGNNFLYLITDDSNVILEIVSENIFDFEFLTGNVFRVYGLSYTGLSQIALGDNVDTELSISGCYDLSTAFISIVNDDCGPSGLDAGTITLVDGSIEFCPGDSTGSRDPLAWMPSNFNPRRVHLIHETDLDGDAYPDFIYGTQQLRWVEYDPVTERVVVNSLTSDVANIQYIEVADMDGDGDVDILTGAEFRDFELFLYVNDGANNFTKQLVDDSWTRKVRIIRAVDYDGDGDMDILAGNNTESVIRLYRNDGNLSFVQEDLVQSPGHDIQVADLDGNAIRDYVVTTFGLFGADSLLVYYNEISELSKEVIDIDIQTVQTSRSQVIDLDLDGDLDIVVVTNDKAVYLYENNNGAYAKTLLMSLSSVTEQIDIADIDQDGDLDITTGNGLFINNGNNEFELLLVGRGTHNVFSDVDDDGDLDIISPGQWNRFMLGDYSFEVLLSGGSNGISTYILTDETGNIIEVENTIQPLAFSLSPAGKYFLYHLIYTDIQGFQLGANLSDLSGDFDLSNPIILNSDPCPIIPGPGPELSIVFSRVSESSQIFDIKNVGFDTIDVSDYWVCRGPNQYNRIGDVVIECGTFNLNMAPGDILGLNLSVMNADGELGLYTSDDFTDPVEMIHFVEWGSAGHTRSGVAIEKGLWNANDFVPSIDPGNSIYFSGRGFSSQSWTEAQTTFCTSLETVATVVFNRIGESSQIIDLINIGEDTVDVNELVIAVGSWSEKIKVLPKECGAISGILAPGEKVGVVVIPTGTSGLSNQDGEIALYNSDMGGSFADLIDFVEWGSSGHTHSTAAIISGLWTANDFVPSITPLQSIYYDGEGNRSTDYKEGNTNICGDFSGRPIAKNTKVNLYPNPAEHVLTISMLQGLDPIDELILVNSGGQKYRQVQLRMLPGETYNLNLDKLESGLYFLQLRSGEEWLYKKVLVLK